jgi:class 3 adenylate cyclase
MQEAVAEISARTGHALGFQAGIANGQAVSGVIGEARPSFDIWGQAVELANRMQIQAAPDTILLNESAFWRLQGSFEIVSCDAEGSAYQLLGGSGG